MRKSFGWLDDSYTERSMFLSPTGFPSGLDGEESTCNVENLGLNPELGRSTGGEHGNPLQYSRMENHMDKGAWRATVHRVAKSQT